MQTHIFSLNTCCIKKGYHCLILWSVGSAHKRVATLYVQRGSRTKYKVLNNYLGRFPPKNQRNTTT